MSQLQLFDDVPATGDGSNALVQQQCGVTQQPLREKCAACGLRAGLAVDDALCRLHGCRLCLKELRKAGPAADVGDPWYDGVAASAPPISFADALTHRVMHDLIDRCGMPAVKEGLNKHAAV